MACWLRRARCCSLASRDDSWCARKAITKLPAPVRADWMKYGVASDGPLSERQKPWASSSRVTLAAVPMASGSVPSTAAISTGSAYSGV